MNYFKVVDSNLQRKEFAVPILIKQDNSEFEVGNIGFKKRVSKFLEDCPEIANKITTGEYKKSDLKEVVARYNQCRNQGQPNVAVAIEETVFEKQPAIEELIAKVSKSNLSNKSDIVEMLEDVKSKLESGDDVPNYLKSAITEAFGDNVDMLKAFEKSIQ